MFHKKDNFDLKNVAFFAMLCDVSTYNCRGLLNNKIYMEERGNEDGCFSTVSKAGNHSGSKD